MMYYRVALQVGSSATWQWRSTVLTSLEALFGFLRLYGCVPKERIRVFFSSSTAGLDAMLRRENEGLVSNSVTAVQFLNGGRRISSLEVMRLEFELGTREKNEAVSNVVIAERPSGGKRMSSLETTWVEPEEGSGGDHDAAYTFSLPTSMPQVLAWIRLLAKVQRGELEP